MRVLYGNRVQQVHGAGSTLSLSYRPAKNNERTVKMPDFRQNLTYQSTMQASDPMQILNGS
jgi:hypothetical protein